MKNFTDITDQEADVLIDTLQEKFADRRIGKTIIQQGNYSDIAKLSTKQLEYLVGYIQKHNDEDRINILTSIVDNCTDDELKGEKFKSLMSNFKEELIKISSI